MTLKIPLFGGVVGTGGGWLLGWFCDVGNSYSRI